MCIKYIYHNRYADGTRDRTEHVDVCRPGGPMCAAPLVYEKDRRFAVAKHQLSSSPHRGQSPLSMTDRLPSPYYSDHLRPPTPRSGHGSGSDRESDHERMFSNRASGVYVNGEKVVDLNRRKHERRAQRPIVLEPSYRAPAAPTPPPIPIPPPKMRRSTTMPSSGPFVVDAAPAEKRPKPIIIENSTRRSKHESKSDSLDSDLLKRYGSRKERDYLEPHPQHRRSSRSPLETYAADDDYERAERRRRRREMRAQYVPEPARVPAADVYGSSPFGSSWGSSTAADSHATTPVIINPSPAVKEVKKELRWEDELRAKQNANIKSRPKLGRSATVTEKPTLHGEVKSILKNGHSPDMAKDDLDQLYASLRGLGLNEPAAGAQRFSRQEKDREDERLRERQEEQEYRDRLKNRFSMPSRRFTVEKGGMGKRRTEVFYPEEGRYKWM